jgi:hypothetical protein
MRAVDPPDPDPVAPRVDQFVAGFCVRWFDTQQGRPGCLQESDKLPLSNDLIACQEEHGFVRMEQVGHFRIRAGERGRKAFPAKPVHGLYNVPRDPVADEDKVQRPCLHGAAELELRP